MTTVVFVEVSGLTATTKLPAPCSKNCSGRCLYKKTWDRFSICISVDLRVHGGGVGRIVKHSEPYEKSQTSCAENRNEADIRPG
jgi:hypothetical protein